MTARKPITAPSSLTFALVAIALGLVGSALLLQSLGIISLDVLRPRRSVPPIFVALIGVFTLSAATIALLRAVRASQSTVNIMGWTVIGLSLVVMTLMVFGALPAFLAT